MDHLFGRSSICPSVWAIGHHAFQSQPRAWWQSLHNGCWFYYHSTTGWRHPTVLLLTRAPALSQSLMVSHVHTLRPTNTHTHTLTLKGKNKTQNQFALLFISHIQAPRGPDRALTYVGTTNVYSCTPTHTHTHTHTHIQTRSFAHVLTHTNLGWLPSCASCFFHQHVFTGRGPLCLHYREAINRKASPGVWKLLFGWGVGGTLMGSEP